MSVAYPSEVPRSDPRRIELVAFELRSGFWRAIRDGETLGSFADARHALGYALEGVPYTAWHETARHRDVRRMLFKLAGEMYAKLSLPANMAKTPWTEETWQWLLGRLWGEVDEARAEADRLAEAEGTDNEGERRRALIRELADVANFCGMAIDVLTET